MNASENIFDELDTQEAESPFTFVKLVKSVKGTNSLSGQKMFTAYVRDYNKLPTKEEVQPNALKSICFVSVSQAREIINKTGFKDAQNNIWFAMPTISSDKNGAYWIRNIDPLLIEFANDNKKKTLEEVNKLYE